MDFYWVPGVNHLATHGRWAFAEFTEVYQIEADFEKKVEAEFHKLVDSVLAIAKQREGSALARSGGSEPQLRDVSRRRSDSA